MKRITLFIFLLLCCLACHNISSNKKDKTLLRYDLPTVPMTVTSQQEANAYMVRHYWDKFPFADTMCVHQEAFLQPLFKQYVNILTSVSLPQAKEGVRRFMELANKEKIVLTQCAALCQTYFHDPNSPYINEEIYIEVLDVLLASPLLDAADKAQPASLLAIAQRNRVGHKALDLDFVAVEKNFPYTDDPDNVRTLYSLKAPYVLLFFNNPGCPNCKEVMEQVLASEKITSLVAKKRLVVLSLYPDAQLEDWQNYLPNLPREWINAYNPNCYVKDNDIYDLKAIPTLYLLDKDKIVLVKDGTTAAQIEQALP